MTKSQNEVIQANLDAEKKTIKELKQVYKQAAKDCGKKVAELNSRSDMQNLQSTIYQKQYQESLQTQLNGILDNMQANEYTTVNSYLTNCYTNGYVGAMYDISKQGIPIVSPIRQDQVVKALQTDSKISTNLYSRLGEDVKHLKNSIRAELSRGIANGSSWIDIADHIAMGMNSPFDSALNNALRIARTEGNRILNEAQMDAMEEAKDNGADIVKQWCATLDGDTRPLHAELDGQIRELDDDFTIEGYSAPEPGHFGEPEMDINCRCCMLQRAKWALDEDELAELQDRAEFFGLDKSEDFEEFKENYLDMSLNDDIMTLLEEGTTKLADAMDDDDYKAYLELLKNNPDTALQSLYANYGDGVSKITYTGRRGQYIPWSASVEFSYPVYSDMSRYETIAHEMGHYFDAKVGYSDLTYNEVNSLKNSAPLSSTLIGDVASSSDQFLEAIRKDKAILKGINEESMKDIKAHNASAGVQDAIDGLTGTCIEWGHGNKYYDSIYNAAKELKEQKNLKETYTSLGFDASNQSKVKKIMRDYKGASEAWANIASAETVGGDELEYIKKYLPNSYESFVGIIKGAK